MQNKNHDPDYENKYLCNSLLFTSILKKKTPEEKIKKIKKYLGLGADINAIEGNYKDNTPLHLAVIKEEPEIVEFLLQNGAQYKKKNYDGKSALDLARSEYPSGNIIKRKEIITLLETFADNNLKPVNISKPPKRPGCPFIINVSDGNSEEASSTQDSKDTRENFSLPSTSQGEDNSNAIETKFIKNEGVDSIENYFNQPHCSKDLFFSSSHDTNFNESVKARIDEVTNMLENLVIRGISEPELKQTNEHEEQVHWREDLEIPSSNRVPDVVSTVESKFKTSCNDEASSKDIKSVGNNLKKPERKISYIQKNIEAISKKTNKSKAPESKGKYNLSSINDEKPTKGVRSSLNRKDLNIISSSPKNIIDADFKKSKEKNFSSAKVKNPLKKM